MQIATREKAALGRVGVDPAADEQVVGVAVVEEVVVAAFRRVAGVACAVLVGYDEVGDEEGVADYRPAEDAAGFEVAGCVGVGEVEEGCAEVGREEDGTEGNAGFGCCGGFEGVF